MQDIAALSENYLSELARIASREPALEVSSWTYERVRGGFGGAIGGTELHRFRLNTDRDGRCSLILKVLYERPGENEQSPYYWKREYEVYRSGMLDASPVEAFSTPRIYGWEDFGDCCWIWMEDIEDNRDEWSLADYHEVGTRLGRFNGTWLNAVRLPDQPWLSCNWHAAIVPALEDTFDSLDALLTHPLARVTLPIAAKSEIDSIWHEREHFREALYRLPQTFCHIDAFRRNILHRDDDVVLIDWALAGRGALGEDLVSLVAVSLYYDRYTEEFADRIDQAVFNGYIKGLRQAGWRGDEDLARLGYTCGMVLRGLAGVKQDISLLIDEARHEQLLQTHDSKSLEEIARFFAAIRRFRLLKMAREARTLLGR